MEISALLYVALTVAAVGFAAVVRNQDYVGMYLSGKRPSYWDRQRGRNLAAEIGVYGLLAGVSACRIAIGADYWVYWLNFQLIAQGRHVSYEPGFRLVVRLMQLIFGDGTYLTIFFLFSVVTVFFFLKCLHDQAGWYSFSVYLLLTGGYYFSSMHSVRYYFALAIAMFAAKYVIRGEYGKFVLWILAAAAFHKSVLLVIPVYLLARGLAWMRWKKGMCIAGSVLAAAVILTQGLWQRIGLWREIIFYFYPFYEGSAFDIGRISWVNVAKCLGVLVLGLIYWKGPWEERKASGAEAQETKRWTEEQLANRFYFFLNLGGLMVYTCGSFIPEVSRVGYYLIVFQIFLIPHLVRKMRGLWRTVCLWGSLGAFAVYFVVFLYRAYDDSVRLLPYLEWIFHK